jgi:hypothetical protein
MAIGGLTHCPATSTEQLQVLFTLVEVAHWHLVAFNGRFDCTFLSHGEVQLQTHVHVLVVALLTFLHWQVWFSYTAGGGGRVQLHLSDVFLVTGSV